MKSVKEHAPGEPPRELRRRVAGTDEVYLFFIQAKKEGYEQISFIFSDTADNEKEHAKRFFKFLEGGEVEITAACPAGVHQEDDGEPEGRSGRRNLEHTVLYPESGEGGR